MNKRTKIDFSKHELIITEQEGLLVHYLKKPDTICDNIKYINTNGILAVTGDYGNWIFCREFHPSPKGYVESGYWHEKLSISSTQDAEEYDSDESERRLKEMINGGAEEYGYTGDKLEKAIEYYTECLDNVYDELDYTHVAHRSIPSFMDYEDVIFCKDYKYWFKAILDGFDEICKRLKDQQEVTVVQECDATEA